jgi:hypothetical protein
MNTIYQQDHILIPRSFLTTFPGVNSDCFDPFDQSSPNQDDLVSTLFKISVEFDTTFTPFPTFSPSFRSPQKINFFLVVISMLIRNLARFSTTSFVSNNVFRVTFLQHRHIFDQI